MYGADYEDRKMRGFNRYIVECKCPNADCFYAKTLSFNRYIVECKLYSNS